MGEADGELEVFPIERRAVTDSLDLELLGEALRDAFHHVRYEGAGEAVQSSIVAAVGRPGHDDLTALLLDLHPQRDDLREGAKRAFHLDAPRRDRDGDSARYFNRFSANTTHVSKRPSLAGNTRRAVDTHQTKQMTSPPMPSS